VNLIAVFLLLNAAGKVQAGTTIWIISYRSRSDGDLLGRRSSRRGIAAKSMVSRTYRTVVTDGQLTVGLVDLGGKDKSVAIAGLTVTYVSGEVERFTIPEAEANVFVLDPAQNAVFSASVVGVGARKP
jgi:hypothetical protein